MNDKDIYLEKHIDEMDIIELKGLLNDGSREFINSLDPSARLRCLRKYEKLNCILIRCVNLLQLRRKRVT